ncbi:Protein TPR1 [Trichinella pseudospiralis]
MSIFLVSVIWLQSWLSAFDDVNPVVGQALASVVDGQWEWNLQLILRFFDSASIVGHAFPCRLLVKDSHFRHTNYDTEDKNEQ